MSKQERVVCAAVELYVIPVENWYASPFTHVFKVVNHEDYKEEELYSYLEILDEPVFGFITNKNRFVDPKEAMEIHLNTIMQLEKPFIELGDMGRRMLGIESIDEWNRIKEFYSRDHLLPEDLY